MSKKKFYCNCGSSDFTKIKLADISKLKRKYGTKHIYKCNSCKMEWWSFFYSLETGKQNPNL